MEAEYVNNEKCGRFTEYQNGKEIQSGFNWFGKKCGIASIPDSFQQVEYCDDRVVYEQKQNNGSYIIRKENGECVESSAYMIQSDANGVMYYKPEGYSVQYKDGVNVLNYITLGPSKSESDQSVTIERMLYGSYHMNVFSTIDEVVRPLYSGHFYNSFEDGFPRDGRGTEFFQDFSGNNRVSLDAVFENDRVASKGQFIADETDLCICNAEWDKDGIKRMTLFEKDGEIVYNGTYKDWHAALRVSQLSQLDLCIPYLVSEIYITSISDSVEVVDFSRFILARLIVIGKGCFTSAKKLVCFHMPCLRTLAIDSGSFNQAKKMEGNVNRFPEQANERRSCIIAYCDMLEVVKIAPVCFDSFTDLVVKCFFVILD